MSEAMDMVRTEIGSDAIILATRTGRRGRGVQVVAAVEQPDEDLAFADEPADEHVEEDVAEAFAEEADEPVSELGDEDETVGAADREHLRALLSYHNVPAALARRLERTAAGFAHEAVADLFSIVATPDEVFASIVSAPPANEEVLTSHL